MIYFLSGKPIPLARPRLGKTHTYDSQSQIKEALSMEILAQRPRPFIITKRPLQLVVTFFMPFPQSWSKIKKGLLVDKPHITRPDIDNCIKMLADVCNGLLYADDSQISSIHARKIWAYDGKTEFQLVEIL